MTTPTTRSPKTTAKKKRNSSGFRFNVSFVDCTSVFVKSVLEASLSFTSVYIVNYNGYIEPCMSITFLGLQVMCEVMERISPVVSKV